MQNRYNIIEELKIKGNSYQVNGAHSNVKYQNSDKIRKTETIEFRTLNVFSKISFQAPT